MERAPQTTAFTVIPTDIGKGHKIRATAPYGDGIGRYGGPGVASSGLTDNGDIEISCNGMLTESSFKTAFSTHTNIF